MISLNGPKYLQIAQNEIISCNIMKTLYNVQKSESRSYYFIIIFIENSTRALLASTGTYKVYEKIYLSHIHCSTVKLVSWDQPLYYTPETERVGGLAQGPSIGSLVMPFSIPALVVGATTAICPFT